MTHNQKLDKAEQGIDNLSELLGISSCELVEIISNGFYRKQRSGVDPKYSELLDDLYYTFKDY